MVRVVGLILFCFIPYLVYGASGYDTAEQQHFAASVQSDAGLIFDKDIQKIRDFINSEEPNFITKISSLNEQEQIVQMRNYLAQKAFNYYYDKYMDELKQKSLETGREIKQERYKNDFVSVVLWLDCGDLDKDKCKKNGLNICDYPDGFEEYEISLTVYGSIIESQNFTAELVIIKDDIANNSSERILITVTAGQYRDTGDVENMFDSSLILDVISTVERYDEHHRWRNQDVADTRAGKYRKPTKKEKTEWWLKSKGLPIGELGMVQDDGRAWQSNSWLPDAAVMSITADYGYGYTQNKQ